MLLCFVCCFYYRHDITEILLKEALNTITLTPSALLLLFLYLFFVLSFLLECIFLLFILLSFVVFCRWFCLFVCFCLYFIFALNWLVYILIVHELICLFFLIEPVCDFDSNCFLDYGNQLLLSSNDTTTMCDICSSLPNATELSSGNITLLCHFRYIPFSYSHNKQCHIIIGLSRFSRHLRNEIQLILFSTT
jgi:energy-coupling factor transporter transmembrane protein EcfT